MVLEELRKKLSSEQPDRKVVKPIKKFTTSFKPDEIYYFQINDEQYKDRYYYNYYVIILVDRTVESDIRLSGLRDEYPLVYFKVCNPPTSIEEVDGIPMALVMYSGPKGNNIEYNLSEDHRIMMYKDGYRNFKKRLHFFGGHIDSSAKTLRSCYTISMEKTTSLFGTRKVCGMDMLLIGMS